MQHFDQINVSKADLAQLPSARIGFTRTLAVITLCASLVACQNGDNLQFRPLGDPKPKEEKSCCSKSKTCQVPGQQLTDLIISDKDIKIRPSENPPSTEDMAVIPAKTVIMGGAREDTTPAREVQVPSFRISRTETTNAEFARFVNETGYVTEAEMPWQATPNGPLLAPASLVFKAPEKFDDSKGSSQWWRLVEGANWSQPEGPGSSIEGRENFPVVHVTIKDAMAYAKWAGRTLPTEAQSRAAATEGDLVPPTTTRPDVREVNFYQGHFPVQDLGLDQYKGMAPVASYQANSNGIYDIRGNGWELTKSLFDETKEYVVIFGGSYLCSWEGDFTCTNATSSGRTSHSVKTSSNHVTFRTIITEPE